MSFNAGATANGRCDTRARRLAELKSLHRRGRRRWRNCAGKYLTDSNFAPVAVNRTNTSRSRSRKHKLKNGSSVGSARQAVTWRTLPPDEPVKWGMEITSLCLELRSGPCDGTGILPGDCRGARRNRFWQVRHDRRGCSQWQNRRRPCASGWLTSA